MEKSDAKNINIFYLDKYMSEISSFLEYGKAYKMAMKDLKAEHWVLISLRTKINGEDKLLYQYDIPVKMNERWGWVIEWRRSRLNCMYPKNGVRAYYSFYYRVENEEMKEYNDCIKSLIAFKAKITLQENNIKKYLDAHKNELFFDPENDEKFIRIKRRLENAKRNVENTTQRLNDIVRNREIHDKID